MRFLRSNCTRFIWILRLTLSEIFDEAAYARYLQRTGVSGSRESYASFLEEKHQAKSSIARCC